jgi:hypothetical protein
MHVCGRLSSLCSNPADVAHPAIKLQSTLNCSAAVLVVAALSKLTIELSNKHGGANQRLLANTDHSASSGHMLE